MASDRPRLPFSEPVRIVSRPETGKATQSAERGTHGMTERSIAKVAVDECTGAESERRGGKGGREMETKEKPGAAVLGNDRKKEAQGKGKTNDWQTTWQK